jgi:hypothetical protein
MKRALIALAAVGLAASLPAAATQFFFSTGNADGLMATASRPDAGGAFEIESGDDFLLTNPTRIESATFQGLLTGNMSVADIGEVRVEIYRVFPLDSDVGRTSGPPTFSTSQVPTRVNSPSDVALLDRDTGSGNLAFTTADLGSFVASNSVTPGGIHPIPGQTTGGNGPASGEQVTFNVDFTTPFTLAPGHYFFVPQVQSTTSAGEFLWLSAAKPIAPPGTPFLPDLQSWTRDQFLDPDWLRVGTDIVGAGTFNAAFSLTGFVPEPASVALIGIALAGLALARRRAA